MAETIAKKQTNKQTHAYNEENKQTNKQQTSTKRPDA